MRWENPKKFAVQNRIDEIRSNLKTVTELALKVEVCRVETLKKMVEVFGGPKLGRKNTG